MTAKALLMNLVGVIIPSLVVFEAPFSMKTFVFSFSV